MYIATKMKKKGVDRRENVICRNAAMNKQNARELKIEEIRLEARQEEKKNEHYI